MSLPDQATRGWATRGWGSGAHRPDIQALRAVAVSLVLVYHLFPSGWSGGFVGVDVFFVISGFLITAHLHGRPPFGGRDLLEFWGRRIRRLLPAALTVLTAILVASRLVGPSTQWEATADQARAAAVYLVNWVLAADSVDYLAAENAPTAVQHFWSLSIEEQFYLGWPVLILVLGLLARRTSRADLVWAGGIGLVVAASFTWSVVATASSPASAYFVTTTRIWELAAGGLLAVVLTARSRPDGAAARQLLALAGLAAIVWSSLSYSGETAFPGWRALVPVLGAGLVLVAGVGARDGPGGRACAWRPVQWLGDVSYSLYLWHWPLIVLVPQMTGRSLTLVDKCAVLVAALVLAGLTKTCVEDPFRTRAWRHRPRLTYALGAAAMSVVVALATLQVLEVHRSQQRDAARLEQALAGGDPCLGAGFLTPGRDCEEWTTEPVPAPALAAKDKPAAYEDVGGEDCFSYLPRMPDVVCEFGDPDGEVTLALVGNSHAGQWLPPLQEIADRRGWRVLTRLDSRCAIAEVRQTFDAARHVPACADYVERTREWVIEQDPDLVLFTNRVSAPAQGVDGPAATRAAYADGYRSLLQAWADAGQRVVAIRDTPAPVDGGLGQVPDCLAEHPDDHSQCAGDRADWELPDPVTEAAADVEPRVPVIDLNDHICTPSTCRAVIGGVVGWFDGSHLTATFARTLAPFLAEELVPMVRQAVAEG